MPHIFLDPDGTQDLGLLVIVEARTGVTYRQQCAGTYCDQRIMEGFVIPIGGAAETKKSMIGSGPISMATPTSASCGQRRLQNSSALLLVKSAAGTSKRWSAVTRNRSTCSWTGQGWMSVSRLGFRW